MNTTGKRKRVITATVSHDVARDAEALAKLWGTTRSALIERGLVILIERALKEEELKVEGEAHFEARPPHWKGRPAKRAGATGRKPGWMKELEQAAETDGDTSQLGDKDEAAPKGGSESSESGGSGKPQTSIPQGGD